MESVTVVPSTPATMPQQTAVSAIQAITSLTNKSCRSLTSRLTLAAHSQAILAMSILIRIHSVVHWPAHP